jgi:hypothetical protein
MCKELAYSYYQKQVLGECLSGAVSFWGVILKLLVIRYPSQEPLHVASYVLLSSSRHGRHQEKKQQFKGNFSGALYTSRI